MVQKLEMIAVLQLLCKSTKKWGVYISFSTEYNAFLDIVKAAPYLSLSDDAQIIGDGCGIILCDTEAEADAVFWSTVGDDGPTKTNKYDGPLKVYALTCNPRGALLNENT